jgi:hypothetical protein
MDYLLGGQGCNMAFTATIMTLCQAGDEIIVPTPCILPFLLPIRLYLLES